MDASTTENNTNDSGIGSMGAVDLRGEDESLSSLDNEEADATAAADNHADGSSTADLQKQQSVELTFASPLAVADASFWDKSTDLYEAVQGLVAASDQSSSALRNKSATQAEALAQAFYTQIDAAVQDKGSAAQRKLWQTATPEHRHSIITSFFLPPGLLATGGCSGGAK